MPAVQNHNGGTIAFKPIFYWALGSLGDHLYHLGYPWFDDKVLFAKQLTLATDGRDETCRWKGKKPEAM